MVLVKVQEGWLEGAIADNGKRKYYSFKGIPYAEPPTGKLRFKSPRPPVPWVGVKQATEHGSVAPQIDTILHHLYIPGDEDCLFLNVYSPNISPENPLPVMFFIHAGGFSSGSGNDSMYGPDFLMNHGVLLVTINYRLDILGFLCLDTKDAPGNAGLKDQVAALKWVQNNIKQFGGDPDNVTIFGNSAGGCAVTLHMLSPMSKGLFKRAIAMSGSPFNEWSITVEPKRRALKLAHTMGHRYTDTRKVFEFFQRARVQDILHKSPQIMMFEENKRYVSKLNSFGPVIEKDFGLDHFLTEEPIDLLKKGKINEADFMIGYTNNECITFMTLLEGVLGHCINNHIECLPYQICYKTPPRISLLLADKIKTQYFGDKSIEFDNMKTFCNFYNDIFMRYPTHSFLNHLSKVSKRRNYLYKFSCVTERNIYMRSGETYGLSGASHLEDLWYLFDAKIRKLKVEVDEKSKSYECIQRSCKLFTNFAKYGNPTPDSSLGATWPEYDNETMQYIDIGEELTTGSGLGRELLQFWHEICENAENLI